MSKKIFSHFSNLIFFPKTPLTPFNTSNSTKFFQTPHLKFSTSSPSFDNRSIYDRFLQKEFQNVKSITDFIFKQTNKEKLLNLMDQMIEVFGENETLIEFNKAYLLSKNQPPQIVIENNLLNVMPKIDLSISNQAFIQKRFIQLVNRYYEKMDKVEQLNEFGLCRELVVAWYFFHIHNKDFLQACNAITNQLDSKEDLTQDQKKLLNLLFELQKGGRVFLASENSYLFPACPLEEHLHTCLRYRLTTYLHESDSYFTDCQSFANGLIESLKDIPNQLKFVQVGWQEKDINLTERSHVLGCSYHQKGGQSHLHFFDPNSESRIIASSLHAEEVLTKSLTTLVEKFSKVVPHANFFLRDSTAFQMKKSSLSLNQNCSSSSLNEEISNPTEDCLSISYKP